MRAQSILLAVLVFVAVGGELFSYSMSTLISRIILVITFLALISAAILAHNLFGRFGSPYRKPIIFAVFFIISLLFLLRRYYLFSPSFMESLFHSERFALAESFNASGFILFNTTHSFIFQHPLLLSFLKDAMGVPLSQVVYVTLLVHVTIVAFAGVIFYEAFRKRFDNKEFGFVFLPPLITFSLVSFAYSERTEIALPLLFLLMSFIFSGGFADRRNAAVILLLVTGITLGSSTAILIMIPFFFLYALFARKITSLIFGLIPLTYLLYVGYSYSLSIRYYAISTIQGVQGFLSQLLGGQVSERVIPWQRLVLPLAGDIQVASATYLSLLLVSALVSLLGLSVWLKYRLFRRGDEKNALFSATLITLLFALGIAALVYIGASVNPESTSSDIRTIAIVFITLLLPFLFLSKNFLKSVKTHKIVLLIIAALLLTASLRTFYEPYPISSHDPVNLVEDIRIDTFAIGKVGDFLRNSRANGTIAFDYKTGPRVANFLSDELQPITFTSELPESDYVVFDINGLKLGSLHTTQDAYEEANNLTSYQNVVYSSGNIIVIQRVD